MSSPNLIYHNSAYRIDSIGEVYNDGISNVANSYGLTFFPGYDVSTSYGISYRIKNSQFRSPHTDYNRTAYTVDSCGDADYDGGINNVGYSYGKIRSPYTDNTVFSFYVSSVGGVISDGSYVWKDSYGRV